MAYGRLVSSEPPSSNHDTVNSRTRSSRLRFLLIFAATLIVACGVSVAVLVGIRNKTTGDATSLSSSYPKPSQAMSKVCSKTRYPTLCVNSLLDFPGSTTASYIDLVHISVNMTLLHFGRALYSSAEIGNLQMDTRARAAYDDCVELLEASVEQLSSSLTSVAPPKERNPQKVGSAADVLTWLSAAMTNQDTCVEGLEDVRGKVKEEMIEKLKDLSELVSNCLAIFAASNGDDFSGIPIQNRRRLLDSSDLSVVREFPKFAATNGDDFSEIPMNRRRRLLDSSDSAVAREFPNFAANGDDFSGIPIVNSRRRLLDSSDSSVAREFSNSAATNSDDFSGIPIQNRRSAVAREFPKWMSRRERRLLELPVAAVQADIIVSQDGNGTCKTIGEAIKKAPEYSNRRIIIYVMAGKYEEPNLKVGRKKTNLMFIGDGKGKTVISGGKSVFDNITTFHTASFAATGAGFIARDITFENWAGPAKHQAVALRVGADHAVIYRCNIIGYQDTLYVHSQRQFYRECDIYGTVDFIFGNAAVVFQNCTMYARKPMDFQKNTITAQNRKDPNQNTGISIHACRILATSDLRASKANFSTYLGRPWKLYSRTVYMLSNMGDHVHPRGWLEWNTTFALDTLYYGEYMNYGPGGAVGQRVKWPGYRVITSPVEANRFTVSQFIFGSSWLPATGVAFLAGLAV